MSDMFVDSQNNVFRKNPDGSYEFVKKAEPPPNNPPAGDGDYSRSAVRGLVRGGLFLPDIGHSILTGGDEENENPLKMVFDAVLGEKKAPSDAVAEALAGQRAKNRGARYLEEAVAGATGGVQFPGSKLVNAVTGATSGIGGEAAANQFGDAPWARIGGSLAGGPVGYAGISAGKLALSALGGPSTRAPELVAAAARGLTDADWAKVQKILDDATAAGVRITPIQAIEKATGLHSLQERVARSEGGGGRMSEFLGSQNLHAANAGRGMMGGVPVAEPTAAALRARGAAGGAVGQAKQMRTDAVKGDYETLIQPFSEIPITPTKRQMEQLLMSEYVGPTTSAGRFLQSEVLNRLGDTWMGHTHGEQIKNILLEARKKLQNKDFATSSGIDDAAQSRIKTGLAPLEKYLDDITVNRQRGEARYGAITEDFVKPLQRGPLGNMRGGLGKFDETMANRIFKTLDSDNVSAQSILQAQGWMSHQDPGAFSQMVKAHFTKKLEAAFEGAGQGKSAPNAPALFAESVWGTAEQVAKRENFRAMVVGAARDAGLPEREVLKGMENLMRVMEAAGRAKGGVAKNVPDVSGALENVLTRWGPGSANSVQFRTLSRIDDWIREKAFSDIADSLTSPEGLKELRQWANFDIRKVRFGGAATTGAVSIMQGQPRESE